MELKLYLDNCCYNRPFDNQEQIQIRLETEAKLFIQQEIKNKNYQLGWSFMLDYENSQNPYNEKRKAIQVWKQIADEFCPPSDKLFEDALKFQELNIRHKDAVHLACAIQLGCDYFLTTDKKLLNKPIASINVIDPINFLMKVRNPDEN